MKNLILLAVMAAIILIIPQHTFAQEKASASSANIKTSLIKKDAGDYRVKVLKKYLIKHNSPLAENAEDFILYADYYNLDWKFVAAISGLESSFGIHIPENSYNGWGWGIYGDNMIRFNSWEEGIMTISQGLRVRYMDKWGASDVYEIGRFYASSPTWAQRVDGFMTDIDKFALNNPQEGLSLSL